MFLLFELVFAVGKPIQDIFAWGFTEIRVASFRAFNANTTVALCKAYCSMGSITV
jgi:hypothetical protein